MRSLKLLSSLAGIFFAVAAIAQDKPAPAAPQADVLIFSNGDQLTGHLERATSRSVVFKSDMAGELTISFDKIKELRSSGNFSLLKKGPPSKTNLIGQGGISVAQGNVTVTPAPAAAAAQPTATLPTKEVGYVIDTPTYDRELHRGVPFTKGWTGAITGGATLVRATDNISSYTAGIALARVMPTVDFLPRRNRTTFNLIETYGKSTSPVIPQTAPPSPAAVTETSIFHTDAERDEYFTPRLYALADLALDHNYSQGLTLQQLYGAGLGLTVIQSAKQQFDVKSDIHYEHQNFQTGDSPDLIGSIIAEDYQRKFAHGIVLSENGNYIPAWNITADYSAMITGALNLPTWKRLSTNLSVTDNYLNDPAPGYEKNSFQFVAGFSYAIK